MSFTSAVTSTNEEAIDTLFGTKTPGADNLLNSSKKEVEDPENVEVLKKSKSLPKQVEKALTPEEIQVKVSQTSAEEVVDDLFGEDEPTPGEKKAPAAAEKVEKPVSDLEVDYKAVYEQMVADGVWGEVEVPDGTEWNADTFKKIQQLQTTSQYNDLLDKTGTYGKAIIEFEKNGGNPGEILGLFRDQRAIQEFDISTKEGQEEFLRSYLTAQGNSEKSIERQIRALTDQGPEAFKEESEEKKSLWDQQYNEEIETRQKNQALLSKEMEEAAKTFNKVITDTLTADPEGTPKDKRELRDYMLNYSQQFQGREVSQFYIDMAEIQKDPANYVELAKFIRGIKTGEYKKKIEAKVKKEVSASTFMKVKNGNALSSRGTGNPDLTEDSGPSFVTYLKKKQS